jgi:hypothetical protein
MPIVSVCYSGLVVEYDAFVVLAICGSTYSALILIFVVDLHLYIRVCGLCPWTSLSQSSILSLANHAFTALFHLG